MDKQENHDNDSLDPSEEYWRKEYIDEENEAYFPLEETNPPHYWIDNRLRAQSMLISFFSINQLKQPLAKSSKLSGN